MMASVARQLGFAALLLAAAVASLSAQGGSTTATPARADSMGVPPADSLGAPAGDSLRAPPADSMRPDSTSGNAGDSASLRDLAAADSAPRPGERPAAPDIENLIREGDAAMTQLEPGGALQAYQAAVALDPSNYESLWKAGRTLIALGELEPRGNPQKDLYNKALKYAERAVKVNPSGPQGHFVRAYALDRVALFEGGKTRIRLAREVRAEAQRAIDLDPLLDEAYHLLGEWNYQLAGLGFVSKLITKTLLGGMPDDVSFENAAHYFELAIQARPDRMDHHLEYGRTLMRLDRKGQARVELQKVLQLPPKELGDAARQDEARELLEQLS